VNDTELNNTKILPFSITDWKLFCSTFTNSAEPINNSIFLIIKKDENSFSYLENGFIRNNLSLGSNNVIFEFGFAGCFDATYDFILSSHQNTYIIEKITPNLLWSISYIDFQIFNKLKSIDYKIGKKDWNKKINRKIKIKISLIYLITQDYKINN
jgi:hypothetical protein